MKDELKRRLGPFLALLDALYLPLLFAIAPQAYAVYKWLHDPLSPESQWVAVLGALGFEMIYVGAIAWADRGNKTRWTAATAFVALIFSIGVAIFVYKDQGAWAVLHAGFPLVAWCYTMQAHAGGKVAAAAAMPASGQQSTDDARALLSMCQDMLIELSSIQQTMPAHMPIETVVLSASEQKTFPCPSCGTPLPQPAYAAARRWGKCYACRDR